MLSNIVENFISKKNIFIGDKTKVLNSIKINEKIKEILNIINTIDDGVVGILLPRNINYILVILALWKSGRAFVPLNYNWPKKYSDLIIKKSKIKYLITDKKIIFNKRIQLIDLEKKKIKKKIRKKIRNNIAYIIFTSGSTGEPKGVQISNRAFITYLNWVKKNQKTGKNLNHLITGEITFDIVLADLAFILANRCSIFITDDPKNVFNTLDLIIKYKINSIYCVPSLIDKIVDAAKALSINPVKFEFVFCGGDIFKIKLFKKIKKFFKGTKIFNMYGPTECTMNTLGVELTKIKNVANYKYLPTGYEFKHLDYLILNEKNKKDMQGELLIGGKQLMDGYLGSNRNNLINPFVEINKKLYYRTGDIFKKRKKLLYFIGRKNQIHKLSGFRFNFSYIENYVEKIQSIKEFKLYINKENLYGFYTCYKIVESDFLINFLKKKFPNFMIPKKIFRIKKFPYNNRGKINYKLLIKEI